MRFRTPAAVASTGSSVLTEKTVAATPYTLILTDAGLRLVLNTAGAGVLTIPANATVAIPTGSCIELYNLGAGLWSVTHALGAAHLQSPYSKIQIAAQFATAGLINRGGDVWALDGELA